jgi:AAA domain-containing protein
MTLPTAPQAASVKDPLGVRVMLTGTPKAGKTTLAAAWAPRSTLIIDTQRGTEFLDGEHLIQPVANWAEFEATVDALARGGHQFKTVAIDLIDDIWNFVDKALAGRGKPLATATDDYNRSAKAAEGVFRDVVGRLLSTPLGVWFVTHAREKEEDGVTRYVAKLDNRVLTYVQGACDFIFLAEAIGPKRRLHTAPNAKFEAGGRRPLPSPMDLDARALYAAMHAALNPQQQTQETRAA